MKKESRVAFGLVLKYPKANNLLFICSKHITKVEKMINTKFRWVVTLTGRLWLHGGTQELQKHWKYSVSQVGVVVVVSMWVYVFYYFLHHIWLCMVCILLYYDTFHNKNKDLVTGGLSQSVVKKMVFPYLIWQLCVQQTEACTQATCRNHMLGHPTCCQSSPDNPHS